MRGVLWACLWGLLCAAVANAQTDRALLIGVTNYSGQVSQIAQPLSGPGHDVALMAELFESFGLSRSEITILTDTPEHLPSDQLSADPTRTTILAELDRLAGQAETGDRIALFLAGHGAQVPAVDDAGELDGLDEVFLPVDFAITGSNSYENFIRDDEFGLRIDKMIAAGAHVWLIADTCNSGTLRRANGEDAIPRHVDLLGGLLPPVSTDPPIDIVTPAKNRIGSFVGFYAAAADALAFETRPAGSDNAHGLLTWSLAEALRQGDATTYAGLAQDVSARLWQVGRGRADPEFGGALGGAHMLARGSGDGSGGSDGIGVAFDDRIAFNAGRLDGLVPGTQLEISNGAGQALFQAVITSAELTRAVAPLPSGPLPGLDAVLAAEGLDPAQFRLRWLEDRAPDLVARVTDRPLELSLSIGVLDDLAEDALGQGIDAMIASLSPAIRASGGTADLRLVRDDRYIALRPVPPGAANVMRVPAQTEYLPQLEMMLRQVAKTHALLAVAGAVQTSALSQNVIAALTIAPGRETASGTCAPSDATIGDPVTVRVGHCDNVTVTLSNQNDEPIDVTPFYLAADYQVFFLAGYDDAERGGWRIPAGQSRAISYTEATQARDGAVLATGPMHLMFLLQKGVAGTEPADFRYLQDIRPPSALRSGRQDGLAGILETAGFGLAKTRSIGKTDRAEGGAIVIPLKTVSDAKERDDAQ